MRLIPTCVGSTIGSTSLRTLPQAHPHVCGEHAQAAHERLLLLGSSPRVWGAPRYCAPAPHRERLIPTCVGSTVGLVAGCTRPTAHPHVCGEHDGYTAENGYVWRLIPTCVGSTQEQKRYH